MKGTIYLVRLYSFLKNSMKNLINLIVDKISIVSKDKTPAVPKANSEFFSVLKIKQGWSKEQLELLEKIKKTYQKNQDTE
nr:MAG TPA: hypothetical protein [Bacteriophage sp.]DAN26447.1 MAG TPA: hypothetical protein [Caudoviricetes sp.]DAS32092.1 MAG TPA: hypothetical protein [Caudoviricetes sp.]